MQVAANRGRVLPVNRLWQFQVILSLGALFLERVPLFALAASGAKCLEA